MRMLPDHAYAGELVGHLVGGNRAHVANVLGHDEVRIEAMDRVGVDLVEGASISCRERHEVVDLRPASADQVEGRPGDDPQRRSLWRGIALMRDGDQLIAQAERKNRFGRAWQELDDPHSSAANRATTCFSTSEG